MPTTGILKVRGSSPLEPTSAADHRRLFVPADPYAQGPVFDHSNIALGYCCCAEAPMLAENVFVVRNFGQSRGFADCLYLLTVAADSTYAFRKAKRPGLQRRGKPQPQRAAEESRRQARWQGAYRATRFETRLKGLQTTGTGGPAAGLRGGMAQADQLGDVRRCSERARMRRHGHACGGRRGGHR